MKFYNQFLRDTRQFQQLHLGEHCGKFYYYCQATSDHLKLRVMFMATTPLHNHESYQKCIFILFYFGGGGGPRIHGVYVTPSFITKMKTQQHSNFISRIFNSRNGIRDLELVQWGLVRMNQPSTLYGSCIFQKPFIQDVLVYIDAMKLTPLRESHLQQNSKTAST